MNAGKVFDLVDPCCNGAIVLRDAIDGNIYIVVAVKTIGTVKSFCEHLLYENAGYIAFSNGEVQQCFGLLSLTMVIFNTPSFTVGV
ncbi:MAG: hypothetical protein EOP48_19025 [Sphingobacteriales bacterium]|nr:MAG: hypothetical protein EOP48_19025 [Sphingobacteriales bacterium]